MATNKKYKMVWVSGDPVFGFGSMYRILALQNIPRHNVKKGDIGGYVSSRHILSHEGDCWIGGEAVVYGRVRIKDNAYIGGAACVTSGKGKEAASPYVLTCIKDDACIDQKAFVTGAHEISGNAVVSGMACLENSLLVNGNAVINGHAKVGQGASVLGKSTVSHDSVLYLNSIVHNGVLVKGAAVLSSEYGDKLMERKLTQHKDSQGETETKNVSSKGDQEQLDALLQQLVGNNPQLKKLTKAGKLKFISSDDEVKEDKLNSHPEIKEALTLLDEVRSDLFSYESDIVKVITYPVMQDKTNPYTVEMFQALKRANRLAQTPEHPQFISAVQDLEKKFLAAESNAVRLTSSLLSGMEKKKIQKAQDLLAIAANEASSEQEKKVAFLQGFKKLEGVIIVPDAAIEAFKTKYNLKEIEA